MTSAEDGGRAFWIDAGYDREFAPDQESRFGAYVRNHAVELAEDWGDADPARFAVSAWRIATPPVLAPGYVRHHPRVSESQVDYNTWDGTLIGRAELVTGRPPALHPAGWRDWPAEHDYYLEPSERELTEGPYLLTCTRALFPLPMDRLPEPPGGQDDAADVARRTVAILVAEMDRIVAPLIAALEDVDPAQSRSYRG